MGDTTGITFDVWACKVEGRPIAGTKRKSHGAALVAVVRDPFLPVVTPDGAFYRLGFYVALTKSEAITQAREEFEIVKGKVIAVRRPRPVRFPDSRKTGDLFWKSEEEASG